MTENYSGSAEDVNVLAVATPLLANPSSPHDAIVVLNTTPGTVVWCADNDGVTEPSLYAARFGVPLRLPFSGQAYGIAFATTGAGEILSGADCQVTPIVVSSPLQRGLFTQVAALYSTLIRRVQPAAATAYLPDVETARGTSLLLSNGASETFYTQAVNLAPRTLEARKIDGEIISWITLTAINAGQWNQAIVIQATNVPSGPTTFDIVAIEGGDERYVTRGRIKGI